jgi:hypothetical protein
MPEWRYISSNAKDWISNAMADKAHNRFTPEVAMMHPWLASVKMKREKRC